MIRIAGNTSHDVGITGLHGTCGAPQRDDTRGAAGRHMIEPARRQSKMLRYACGRIRKQRE